MANFAVSYQLNKQKNYQRLWDALEGLDAHKVMRSFWFVDWTGSAAELRDYLRQYVDNDDAICVVPIGQRPAHIMGYKGTNDWLNARY